MTRTKTTGLARLALTTALLVFTTLAAARAQEADRLQPGVHGALMMRAYNDQYFGDNAEERPTETYMRYLGRLSYLRALSPRVRVYGELLTLNDRSEQQVRNFAGSGVFYLGVSRLFAEARWHALPWFHQIKFRLGRQGFAVGRGLVLGNTYYAYDRFDGARIDLIHSPMTLSLFAAITHQELSATTGNYPEPEQGTIFAATLSTDFPHGESRVYGVLERPEGDFNDDVIIGALVEARLPISHMRLFAEAAAQWRHTIAGFPKSFGVGAMAGITDWRRIGPFKRLGWALRWAGIQGDDPATGDAFEAFTPLYSAFAWGERAAIVGPFGDRPIREGGNADGLMIFYARVYAVPERWPDLRIQLHLAYEDEWTNSDGIDVTDNEAQLRLRYRLSPRNRLQVRLGYRFPNDRDKDVDGDGTLERSEDRTTSTRLMFEWLVGY